MASTSKSRLWLERAGVALVTVAALGTPLLLGFFGYLALGDGLEFNSGDPLRETRIWMIKDNRRLRGLAVLRQTAVAQDGLQCARASYSALLWSPQFSTESNSASCVCYAIDGLQLRQSPTPCN
jgi:hypothetical protein